MFKRNLPELQTLKYYSCRFNRYLPIGVVTLLTAGLFSWGHAQVNVLTQHNNNARTGTNLQETVLTPDNVNPQRFGMLFKRVVDDQIYGQPLYVTNVKVGGGFHDLVYVTTVNNSVYAFDANDPGAAEPFWHVNFGVPPNVYDGKFNCTDMTGNMGIIGTPVIDPETRTLYTVAVTRVGNGFEQRLHALDLATGADRPRSPVTITAPGFDPLMQSPRPALLLARGNIYIGYASHCDKEPYHGFLLSYGATSLRQIAVFNTSPTGDGASIWQFGQGPAVGPDGNLYFVTGNGTWDGRSNFSESFLKLSPQLKLLDWFTPSDHVHLDDIDADLDCSGAMLVPGTHLAMGAGKQGVLYLVDTARMGHLGDNHAIQHFQATGSQLPSLVYWNSAKHGQVIYMWGEKDRLRVYQFNGGKLDEKPLAIRPDATEGHPGAMLSLSANGNKKGILWAAIHATGDSWAESRPGVLHAYDADDVTHELWNSLENPQRDDCGNYAKTAPPTIVNGRVYLASFGTKNIGSGQFCVYGLLPDGDAPLPPVALKAVTGDAQVALTWQPSTGAAAYRVKRSTKSDGSFETIAEGLTSPGFTDIGVFNGNSYAYEVTAINSNGESTPSSVATAVLPEEKWDTNLLPSGPGRDVTVRVCSGCHSPALAAKEHLNAQEWHDLVRVMAARGAVASDSEFDQISLYLARSFPKSTPRTGKVSAGTSRVSPSN